MRPAIEDFELFQAVGQLLLSAEQRNQHISLASIRARIGERRTVTAISGCIARVEHFYLGKNQGKLIERPKSGQARLTPKGKSALVEVEGLLTHIETLSEASSISPISRLVIATHSLYENCVLPHVLPSFVRARSLRSTLVSLRVVPIVDWYDGIRQLAPGHISLVLDALPFKPTELNTVSDRIGATFVRVVLIPRSGSQHGYDYSELVQKKEKWITVEDLRPYPLAYVEYPDLVGRQMTRNAQGARVSVGTLEAAHRIAIDDGFLAVSVNWRRCWSAHASEDFDYCFLDTGGAPLDVWCCHAAGLAKDAPALLMKDLIRGFFEKESSAPKKKGMRPPSIIPPPLRTDS